MYRARSRFLPVRIVLAAAIHVYGCQLDEVRLPWLPPAMNHLVSFIEGILQKGSYLPCVSMAGRALLAGYPRHMYMWLCNILWFLIVHWWKINLILQQQCYVLPWYTFITIVCITTWVMHYHLENITPDTGLALVVPAIMRHNIPYRAYTFLDVKHCLDANVVM